MHICTTLVLIAPLDNRTKRKLGQRMLASAMQAFAKCKARQSHSKSHLNRAAGCSKACAGLVDIFSPDAPVLIKVVFIHVPFILEPGHSLLHLALRSSRSWGLIPIWRAPQTWQRHAVRFLRGMWDACTVAICCCCCFCGCKRVFQVGCAAVLRGVSWVAICHVLCRLASVACSGLRDCRTA